MTIKRENGDVRMTVALKNSEFKRILDLKPPAMRSQGGWLRQLAMERVAQLEQAAKAARSGR